MVPSPALIVAQLCAVVFVLALSPLLRGILERFKARLLFRQGPPVTQPYRDLRKWFAKERLRSPYATWLSGFAPFAYFIAPVLVASMIPVLTAFPLPFAFTADMLGAGFVLGGAGLFLLLAAFESGSAFSTLGVSRVRLVGVFSEPIAFLAVFAASASAHATIPFVVNQVFNRAPWLWSPTHVLLMLAWFLLLLAETGRIPVDNPSSAQELSLIDPARTFEAAGPDLALYEWGGWMKFMVLSIVLANVLTAPFGLAASLSLTALALAVVLVFAKLTLLGLSVVVVEVVFAKLRLLRIPEYLFAAVLVAAAAGAAALL
jgi:formate hydrogenlyase subunit 4